ncbi:TonB-dependent receptor [Endozoicomonadaceae bacterium StTr2]
MLKQSLSPLALAVAFAAYGPVPVSAAAEEVTKLEKVVVTASRAKEQISSIAGTVQVITGAEIAEQAQPGKKLADMLERLVPGMGPSTQTVTDRTQSLRGRKILVLIDGVSQSENRQISRQLNSIRPENIERIEVVSGASAIYGGGATGGIINIITKSAKEDNIRFSSEAGIRTDGSHLSAYTLSQSVQGRKGAFDYLVSGTFEQRNSFFDADGHRTTPDPSQVSRSDSDTKDALIKLGYDIDENKRLQATVQIYRDQMDSKYAPNYGDNLSRVGDKNAPILEPVKGLKLNDQPYTDRDSINFVYSDEEFFGNRLTAQAFYREREARFYPYVYDYRKIVPGQQNNPAFTLVNQSTSKAKVYGLKVNLEKEFSDQLRLSYGLDYDIDKGEQQARSYDGKTFIDSKGKEFKAVGGTYDYGPDVTTKTLGLFAQGNYDLVDDVTLNFGWRHERANMDIGDYNPVAESWFLPVLGVPASMRKPLEGATKKYNANLFNFGVVYRFNDDHQAFINYSEGFEVPDAARLLRNAVAKDSVLAANPLLRGLVRPTSVASANLDAIKIKSYELGWRGQFENADAAVTLFYNQSDKTIDFNSDFSVDLLDQKKRVYGIEARADYFVNDNWSVGGSYAFTEGRSYYKDIGKWLDLQAADVSPQKITAYVRYEQDGMNVRLQAVNFADYDKGKKYTASSKTYTDRKTKGYTTVDLMASYDLPVGTVSGGITNLFNEDYQTVYSQWARQTYDGLSSSKAEGRAYVLSYRVEY